MDQLRAVLQRTLDRGVDILHRENEVDLSANTFAYLDLVY